MNILDLFADYFSISMSEEYKDITTYFALVPSRSILILIGFMNAPSKFQRMIDNILREIPFARVYLKDFFLLSRSIKKHLEHICLVFDAIQKVWMKLNITKFDFSRPCANSFRHYINKECIHIDKLKSVALKNATITTNRTKLRSFFWLSRILSQLN